MASIPLKFQSLEELVGNLQQLDNPTLNYLVAQLRKLQVERGIANESRMMSEKEFWALIQLIDWKEKNRTDQLKPLVTALSNEKTAAIFQFSERLAYFLHQLDGPDFTKVLERDKLGFSADTFLYVRCLVVAKGKKFYNDVLKNPEKIPVQVDFEDLLYIAEKAYQQKTGKPFQFVPTFNYESFFNQELWGDKAIVL